METKTPFASKIKQGMFENAFGFTAGEDAYIVRAVNRDDAFDELLSLVKEFTGFVNVTVDFHARCVAAVAKAGGEK